MNWKRKHLNWKVGIGTALVAIGVAGGTALAAGNGSAPSPAAGGPAGAMPPPPMMGVAGPGKAAGDGKLRDQFASELAGHLDGVSAGEVSKALEQVAARARAGAAHGRWPRRSPRELDGVERAGRLGGARKGPGEDAAAVESGKPPEPGTLREDARRRARHRRERGHRRDARCRGEGLRRRRPRERRPRPPATNGLRRDAADAGRWPHPRWLPAAAVLGRRELRLRERQLSCSRRSESFPRRNRTVRAPAGDGPRRDSPPCAAGQHGGRRHSVPASAA